MNALNRAAKKSGVSQFELIAGFAKCRPVTSGLRFSEYVALELHQKPVAERQAYIGALGSYRFGYLLNQPRERRGVVADKLLFDMMMRGAGYRVPHVQAVYGYEKCAADVVSLSSREALRNWLHDTAVFPLFGKPQFGQRSDGVIALTGYDAARDILLCEDGSEQNFESFEAGISPLEGYLFQSRLEQHPELVAVTGAAIGTVRLITFRQKGKGYLLGAFWKVPRIGAVADNLWRKNLLAGIELETGRITTARMLNASDEIDTHPDTGATFDAFTMPDWSEACAMVANAATLLTGLQLIGWDVAFTVDGPVIVEANTSPSLDILQYVSGQGALAGSAAKPLTELIAERRAKSRPFARMAKRIEIVRRRLADYRAH